MSRAALILVASLAALAACEPAKEPLAAELQGRLTLLGTEPFWGVEIENSGEATLTRIDHDAVHAGRVKREATADGARFTATADGETLSMTLKKETCSDGMSDRVYPYAAEVEWQGETLRGCAIRPEDMRPE